MAMEGTWSNTPSVSDSKYLYNGKEMNNDFGLDWMDYGARFYDGALGRWHSIDPRSEKYYDYSPYNYAANNPILFIDPNGKDIIIHYDEAKKDKDGNFVYDKEGKMEFESKTFNYDPSESYEGDDKIENVLGRAMNKIVKDGTDAISINGDDGKPIQGNAIKDFAKGGKFANVTVQLYTSEYITSDISYADPKFYSEPSIHWNPTYGLQLNEVGDQKKGYVPPMILLVHEFAHVWYWTAAPQKYGAMKASDAIINGNQATEELAMKVERMASLAYGLGVRIYHGSIRTGLTTETETSKKVNTKKIFSKIP